MKIIKYLIAFLLFLLSYSGLTKTVDSSYSYLYIQGDKVTPFYVKIDGRMQSRYGKNYCIIPKLKAGSIKVEILFQQNMYPPETFSIEIPNQGAIGFLLEKQNNIYSLYDFKSKTYIQPDKQ